MKNTIVLLMAFTIITGCAKTNQWTMKSPDGLVSAMLYLGESGEISYEAKLIVEGEEITAIESSLLGIERKDATFISGFSLISIENNEISDSYTLSTGKKREISYVANETQYVFKQSTGEILELYFRVFNDGVAFRYHFPGEGEKELEILKELTTFNLPDEGTCWSQAYDTISHWTPAYETYFERSMSIGTTAPANKNGWSFPLTFHTGNIWGLITESVLDGTYPGTHLQPDCEGGEYSIRFPEPSEALGNYGNLPHSSLPWSTPWRVIVLGTSPANIVESTIVTDLAPPSEIDDPSWIKPGRASWSWWSDSDSPQYMDRLNSFTDLAVDMGWEYTLIDANWNMMKQGNVEEVINYAVERKIGPILWYNSGARHNQVTEEPRDKMWDPEIRAAEFKKIADWGVKGVKVDFFQSDKQDIINQYLGILKDAAENKILVNFHGCTLPRGWNRTWPNMVTLEAVRGGEVYKFGSDYPEYAPWHNTVLPFTRNAVGPMDYTPVMFSDHTYPHLTTYAHELATSVVFESGIIHMADKVEEFLSLPETAKKFLMEVPSVWDDTKYVDGYPGQFIILARQSGSKWYVAGLNGTDEQMELVLNSSFLAEGNYKIDLISDGETDQEFTFSISSVEAGESIPINVLPYGGFAGTITVE